MRISALKVVKYCTFLVGILLVNIWLSFDGKYDIYSNFKDRGKVVQSVHERRAVSGGRRGDKEQYEKDKIPFIESPRHSKHKLLNTLRGNINILTQNNIHAELENEHFPHSENRGKPLVELGKNGVNIKKVGAIPPKISHINAAVGGKVVNRNRRMINQLPFNNSLRQTELNDLFISVKTSGIYHKSRIHLILQTWYLLAKNQTHFFTDTDDPELKELLGDHIINTNCSASHGRKDLSCKMSVELDYFMASRKRWFCHMDDDNYLNVPRLLQLLQNYDHRQDWYLGKPSLSHPLEITDPKNNDMMVTFWFATGGAGFCISRGLALKMSPYASGGRFMTTAELVRLPDDCTIGYIVDHLLKKELTVIPTFHSHLEALHRIKLDQLKDQITLSFSKDYPGSNKIKVPGFAESQDPTRFRSLHCLLYPNFQECKGLPKNI